MELFGCVGGSVGVGDDGLWFRVCDGIDSWLVVWWGRSQGSIGKITMLLLEKFIVVFVISILSMDRRWMIGQMNRLMIIVMILFCFFGQEIWIFRCHWF